MEKDIMHVYMMVTQDKYELPLAIADSSYELARITGTNAISIRSAISHAKDRNSKRSKWVKVEIDEER